MASTTCSVSCPPRWATPRTPDRPTDGHRDANVARALGLTLAPWQRSALEVAGELHTDRGQPTGRMMYPVVVWIVPRRAGKSVAAFVRLLSKATTGPRVRCWYTPHRREVGSALWRDEWFPLLEQSRLHQLAHVRRSNGSETITIKRLASTVRLFAPDGQALRSQNADLVVVDEAREFDAYNGDRLEAAVRPAQARRRGRQLWIVSSAGGPESAWLARYRDLGRAGTDGVCYLEYAAPEDLPWDDPATWMLGHPSLADGSVDVDTLAADAATMDPTLFQTEYLGWWRMDTARGIDLSGWARCGEAGSTMPAARRWIAADIATDRSTAAVAVAATDGDRVHVEVVAAGAGTAWVARHVLDLAGRGTRVRLDAYGPAGNLVAELSPKLRDRLEVANTGDVARACGTMHDLVSAGRLRHREQPELDAAVAGAVARRHGDAWLWDRRVTDPALLAATLAAEAAARPTATAKPTLVVAK